METDSREELPRNQPRRTWLFTIYTQDISNPATYRSDQAFRILGSPPYFRIPVETAAQIAEANKFKPVEPADPAAAQVPSAPPAPATALVQIVRSAVKEATTRHS